MRRWVIHLLMIIIGASLGLATLPSFWRAIGQGNGPLNHELFNGIIGAIIFLILSFFFSGLLLSLLKKIDRQVAKLDLSNLLFNFIGAILGLLLGILISIPLNFLHVPVLTNLISFLLILGLAYLGYTLFHRRGEDILRIVSRKRSEVLEEEKDPEVVTKVSSMVLDTSTIIDGRILDVLKTGFIAEQVIVPQFVLLELQLISDSSDNLKRAKGRRGLDLVNELTKFDNVKISDKDYTDIREVDTKLLRFASETGARLVTNDFNLNKVAEIQGVTVLNINDLANAVKTQLLVGEIVDVTIIKAGSERQQGVAYLPDGTMIVVEDTAKMIDKTVKVEVAKVLQTSAGRMIFADLVRK